MKSKKIIALIVLAVLSGSLVTAFGPSAAKVLAAPQCFSGNFGSTGSTNVVPYTGRCEDGPGGFIDEASSNCYGITSIGSPVQINCTPPYASTTTTTAENLAKCFVVTEMVTNPDDPGGDKFPRYRDIDCYDQVVAGMRNIELTNPNKCYVIDTSKKTATDESCVKMYLQTLAVQAIDARLRADITNTATVSHVSSSTCSSANISSCGFFASFVLPAINFLSAGVVLIVIIMIVVGGIRYSSAGDNPQAAAAAKGHIYNAIIALLLYFFLFSLLQWIIPGGIF